MRATLGGMTRIVGRGSRLESGGLAGPICAMLEESRMNPTEDEELEELAGELGLSGLSGVELTGLLADVEVQRRRLESVDQGLLAEVAGRGVAGEYACSGPVELLVQLLRVDGGLQLYAG